tara:strand:+ start:1718 stop:2704 length:987 start_codon:yes stop_codon:yes gene_type:complete
MAGLEVRRLLNRAVASSLGDEAFLVEARRLTREHGCELLQAILTNASLDVVQAQLMHGLLCRLPLLPPAQSELSDAESASPAVELLFNTLRKLLSLAGELSTIRTQSLLLFLGLLTMPQLPQLSPPPPPPAAAATALDAQPPGTENGHDGERETFRSADTGFNLERSAPRVEDDANGTDDGGGRGGGSGGSERCGGARCGGAHCDGARCDGARCGGAHSSAPSGTDSSAAISPSASSTAALVSRNELLAKVLLPPLQRAQASFVSSSAELSLILQAFPSLLCFASLELYLSLHRNSHLSTALLSLLIITLSFMNSHLSNAHRLETPTV